jgi:DNA polymerase elongation subunit (family B)
VGLSFGARGKKALLFAGHWNADPPDDPAIEILPDEKALLVALSERIREFDPDIITGWNVIDFDFPRLAAAFSRHDGCRSIWGDRSRQAFSFRQKRKFSTTPSR